MTTSTLRQTVRRHTAAALTAIIVSSGLYAAVPATAISDTAPHADVSASTPLHEEWSTAWSASRTVIPLTGEGGLHQDAPEGTIWEATADMVYMETDHLLTGTRSDKGAPTLTIGAVGFRTSLIIEWPEMPQSGPWVRTAHIAYAMRYPDGSTGAPSIRVRKYDAAKPVDETTAAGKIPDGALLVDVPTARSPIAVDDTLVVRRGVPTTIDIAANDIFFSAGGDTPESGIHFVARSTPGDGGEYSVAGARSGVSVTYDTSGKVEVLVAEGTTAGSVSLPYYAWSGDPDGVTSREAAGVLKIVIPKKPKARPDKVSLRPGGSVEVDLLANDFVDQRAGAPHVVIASTSWSHRGLTYSTSPSRPGKVTISSNGWSGGGAIWLRYIVVDGAGQSTRALLSIDMKRPPVARHDQAVVTVGKPSKVNVLRNDAFTGRATVRVVKAPPGVKTQVDKKHRIVVRAPRRYKGKTIQIQYELRHGNGLKAKARIYAKAR